MSKTAPLAINLVPKDPFFATPIGKVLKWALSIGRYIVIFTELVVIISFVTRFSLDVQVTDLNEAINQKQVIIESYGDLESEVRAVQKKIDQYNQVAQQTNLADIFPELSQITPSDVKLDELSITPGTVSMQGVATTNASLNTFINNLQLAPNFREVVIDRIETGDSKEPGFHFSIRAQTGASNVASTQSRRNTNTR